MAADRKQVPLSLDAPTFSPPVPASDVGPPAAVGHVAVRLPDFWEQDPEFWFMQADSIFRSAGVTRSLTKYDHCLARLPASVVPAIRDLALRVRTGVVDDPYGELEAKLTSSFQKGPWQRAFALLDLPDLGDRRPSVLMDQMLALLPSGEVPGRIFLALFLRRLPADMRDQLAAQDITEPGLLASAANRIFDARPQPGFGVSAVQQGRRSPSPARDQRRRSPSRQGRRPATPAAANRAADDGEDGLCYFHSTFGRRAHRCRPPCSWSGNGRAAGGGN
jgi:hypothetical protein